MIGSAIIDEVSRINHALEMISLSKVDEVRIISNVGTANFKYFDGIVNALEVRKNELLKALDELNVNNENK